MRSVVDGAIGIIDRYDHHEEAEKFALSLQGAGVRTAVAELSALRVGTAAGTLATTVALMDITGVSAILVASLGLRILPNKRRQAGKEYRQRTSELHEYLRDVVEKQFEDELADTGHDGDRGIPLLLAAPPS